MKAISKPEKLDIAIIVLAFVLAALFIAITALVIYEAHRAITFADLDSDGYSDGYGMALLVLILIFAPLVWAYYIFKCLICIFFSLYFLLYAIMLVRTWYDLPKNRRSHIFLIVLSALAIVVYLCLLPSYIEIFLRPKLIKPVLAIAKAALFTVATAVCIATIVLTAIRIKQQNNVLKAIPPLPPPPPPQDQIYYR